MASPMTRSQPFRPDQYVVQSGRQQNQAKAHRGNSDSLAVNRYWQHTPSRGDGPSAWLLSQTAHREFPL